MWAAVGSTGHLLEPGACLCDVRKVVRALTVLRAALFLTLPVLTRTAASVSPVGKRCQEDGFFRTTTEMFRNPPLCPPRPPPPPPFSACGSNNCGTFVGLHINVASAESTPALPVARRVCLPLAAVTVDVERARRSTSPQRAHCCRPWPHQIMSLRVCLRCRVIRDTGIELISSVCLHVQVKTVRWQRE